VGVVRGEGVVPTVWAAWLVALYFTAYLTKYLNCFVSNWLAAWCSG